MKNLLILIIVLSLASCTGIKEFEKPQQELTLSYLLRDLQKIIKENKFIYPLPEGSEFEDIDVDKYSKTIIIKTNKNFSYQYFRESNVSEIYSSIKNFLGQKASDYKLKIETLGYPIEDLIPNIYREKLSKDTTRMFTQANNRPKNIVSNISKPFIPQHGLQNRNIALWPSHGRYYNHKYDRWMWQRARLFQIVEDLGPLSFTMPYIVPMLENAGANVFVPRERDIQLNEIIVDNDDSKIKIELTNVKNNLWKKGKEKGFAEGQKPYHANFNPFLQGSHLVVKTEKEVTATANYIPEIPEEGNYNVYISYNASKNNITDAHYTVYHSGGKTEFKVNQQIGGNTWIYLGNFNFKKGINSEIGKVVLDNKSSKVGRIVSADAVRFGGGMGIIERNGETSGYPKFMEGSRYYLQYSGMPDTLVYNINGDTLDYNDDYQSRAEWVNYLVGAPYGPNKDRKEKGLGILIDLSLAFHTDAGVNLNDTTIGTLSIYSISDADSVDVFPDGVSRLANRDFADIMQTQIVEDLQIKYDSIWTRRALRDARYSEAFRQNVPSVLLELLSHQNFLDNKFQLDPRFRFDVSRSIYKAILKFIAIQNEQEFVIQPLPVTNFYTSLDYDGNIKLSWKGYNDLNEPSAIPKKYIVYRKIGDNGFDNGTLVSNNEFTYTDTKENTIYSFKVTAINEGGESFPSEILSACSFGKNKKPFLIVNGFDRVSAPASIKSKYFTGFLNNIDAGVPDKFDISFTGLQHNFDPSNNWTSDDMPGHGASYADYETKVIAGNTFDFPYIHGSSIVANGYPFVSSSDEAIWDKQISLNDFEFVDFIMGEEKTTDWPLQYSNNKYGKQFEIFPDSLKIVITDYLNSGGNIFISGSYIGTDLFRDKDKNHKDAIFGNEILKYKLSTDHAARVGEVISNNKSVFPKNLKLNFNTSLNDSIYAVEAPDALGEINGSETILKYSENGVSAAIAYKENYGIIAFGFPFETIDKSENQKEIMKYILKFLLEKKQ